ETAILEVRKGRFYVSPAVTQGVVDALREPPPEPPVPRPAQRPVKPVKAEALTPREQDIVRLVGRGLCNKEIAHELGVSVTTARPPLSRIYGKPGAESGIELALYAAQSGETVM